MQKAADFVLIMTVWNSVMEELLSLIAAKTDPEISSDKGCNDCGEPVPLFSVNHNIVAVSHAGDQFCRFVVAVDRLDLISHAEDGCVSLFCQNVDIYIGEPSFELHYARKEMDCIPYATGTDDEDRCWNRSGTVYRRAVLEAVHCKRPYPPVYCLEDSNPTHSSSPFFPCMQEVEMYPASAESPDPY